MKKYYKNIIGFIAVFVPIVLFINYYLWALEYYKDCSYPVKDYAYWMLSIMYYAMFLGQSLLCLALSIKANRLMKYLVYLAGFEFWLVVFLSYLLRDLGMINSKNLILIFIFGTFLIGTIIFLWENYRLQRK